MNLDYIWLLFAPIPIIFFIILIDFIIDKRQHSEDSFDLKDHFFTKDIQ